MYLMRATHTMTPEPGFDFNDFGGNVEVVIVKHNKDALRRAVAVQGLRGEPDFTQFDDHTWSYYAGNDYPAEGAEGLARMLSQEFATRAIWFFFADASNWMGYKLFVNGDSWEDYNFGESSDESNLLDAAHAASAGHPEQAVTATDEEEEESYIFWSRTRTATKKEIMGGEDFIDAFLRSEKAYIGWELGQ